MTIRVVVELQAKTGRRDELKNLLETIATQGPRQQGFLGNTRYEVLDNPDMLVEIAEWESAERAAHVQEIRWPPAPTRLCSSCLSHRSGSRFSGGCPDRPSLPARRTGGS
jgi:quinol monooxygenase YgiN